MTQTEVDKYVKDRIEIAALGGGTVGVLALLLLAVAKWARWRGKRNHKKRTPELPGFTMMMKRNLFGRRKFEAKYLA